MNTHLRVSRHAAAADIIERVCYSRNHAQCWWAGVDAGHRETNLGLFNSRDEGTQAIIDWFRRMDIEEWASP